MTNFMKNFTEVTAQESFKKFGFNNMADIAIYFFNSFKEKEIKKDIKNNNSVYFDICFNDAYIDAFIDYDELCTITQHYHRTIETSNNKAIDEAIDLFYNDLLEIYLNI